MKTIKDFIKENRITISVQLIQPQNMTESMFQFFYTVTANKHTMTGTYKTGTGHAYHRNSSAGGLYTRSTTKSKSNTFGTLYKYKINSLTDLHNVARRLNIAVQPTQPEPSDILAALALDASCWEDATDFEDFCANLGYTGMKQYREARAAFDACARTAKELRAMLGNEKYEELLYNIDPY